MCHSGHREPRQVDHLAVIAASSGDGEQLPEHAGIRGDDREVSMQGSIVKLDVDRWRRIGDEGLVDQVHPGHWDRVGLEACSD